VEIQYKIRENSFIYSFQSNLHQNEHIINVYSCILAMWSNFLSLVLKERPHVLLTFGAPGPLQSFWWRENEEECLIVNIPHLMYSLGSRRTSHGISCWIRGGTATAAGAAGTWVASRWDATPKKGTSAAANATAKRNKKNK
jgi:hypothetical protein